MEVCGHRERNIRKDFERRGHERRGNIGNRVTELADILRLFFLFPIYIISFSSRGFFAIKCSRFSPFLLERKSNYSHRKDLASFFFRSR